MRTFTKDTALSEQGRGAAWQGNGMGAAWERRTRCESVFRVSSKCLVITIITIIIIIILHEIGLSYTCFDLVY
jgi:hypothetical protein